MKPVKQILVVALSGACLVASVTCVSAAWVVDAQGNCVRAWDPKALENGPSAVADAPLVPVRYAAGGVQELREPGLPGYTGDSAFFRTIYVPLTFASSMQDAMTRITFGVADTVTGGYFHLTGDDPDTFTVHPTPLGVLGAVESSPLDPRPLDACGREVYPLYKSHDENW